MVTHGVCSSERVSDTGRSASAGAVLRTIGIGSQGRRNRVAALFPHPPFYPCVRFSRTRLTDGPLDMVTQPSGSGWCRATCADPGRGTRPRSSVRPDPVSYTHLRAHEPDSYLVCRLLLEKK